ncbi:ribokinase [Lusitaniella coriacea]|uniref:ribokinase n=1 Tax=Lusitaniella coriacea TaxID=1983105 RepID=UPI003CFB4710
MSILVFGSLNMDFVAQVPRMPVPGESVLGHNFVMAAGGKGANQAVAAARLGTKTAMVGRVGRDRAGEDLLAQLHAGGVNTEGIFIDEETHSGVALIAVDDRGENQIIVVPGTNGRVNREDVARLTALLTPETSALLLQLEIPLSAVQAAAQTARERGITVILDPAPAPQDFPAKLYPLIDVITPNEVEATQLVGFPVEDRATATQAAQTLVERGVSTAIVKLGDRGLVCTTSTDCYFISPYSVRAIDSVAAGDAFNGGFASARDRGLSLPEALKWGAACGALTTTQSGAQPALPHREAVERLLHSTQE